MQKKCVWNENKFIFENRLGSQVVIGFLFYIQTIALYIFSINKKLPNIVLV